MKQLSLWGEEFVVEDSVSKVDKVLARLEKMKTEDPVKIIKSKAKGIPLEFKLAAIYSEVDRILGHYKERTRVIKTREELHDYIDIAIHNKVLAVDTETNNSLDPLTCTLMGVCIYTPGEKSAYIPINHTDLSGNRLSWQLTENDIKEEFERLKNTKLIFHNYKFDYEVLKCTCGCTLEAYWDTALGARILDENEHASLKEQFIKKINPGQEKYSIDHLFVVEYAFVDPEKFALYAATDSYMTYELFKYQKVEFSKEENKGLYNVFMNVEMPCAKVTAEMELYGVRVDHDYANILSQKYQAALTEAMGKINKEIDSLRDKIERWRKSVEANSSEDGKPTKASQLKDPINIASSQQLAILLYDVLKVSPVDKKDPRGTGEKILKQIDLPICSYILEYRGVSKLLSTYVDSIPERISPVDGRLHASFKQLGTETGRYSSEKPNLQNIPSANKEIRMMYVPSEGYALVGADYSQQEPRILASFSGDQAMYDAYKTGKDLYAIIASQVYHNNYEDNLEHYPDGRLFEEGEKRRKTCKALLLGIMYGMGALSLAEKIKSTEAEARKIINNFYQGFPKVKKWIDDTERDARKTGFVEDLWGRRRRLPTLLIPDFSVSVGGGREFNPLLGCKGLYNEKNKKAIDSWRKRLSDCRNKQETDSVIAAAEREGITIHDNRKLISRPLRQCVNARIQGSAASMTKKAMVAVYNDPVMQELGFKLLIPIHDELIGECPKENAEKAAQRLSELMVEVAKDRCKTPMSCDAEITNRWYEAKYISNLKKSFRKLMAEKGLTREEALVIIKKEHPESVIFDINKCLEE